MIALGAQAAQLAQALPDALRNDAGLAMDRFDWRVRAKQTDLARALLLERSTSAEALAGLPDDQRDAVVVVDMLRCLVSSTIRSITAFCVVTSRPVVGSSRM